MSVERIDGPDFICVGLARAGTGWLYDQLARHPDFWMPPIKELHYFDRPFPSAKMRDALRTMRAGLGKGRGKGRKHPDVPLDDRDAAFIDRAATIRSDGQDLDLYASLFAFKDGSLSGDVSPNYADLDEAFVRKVAARFDQTKVVLLLRDPVERTWSHWRMRNRSRATSAIDDLDAFQAFLQNGRTAGRWTPTSAAALWSKAFGDRFRYFFLDDIARQPEQARADILSFVGSDPSRPSRAPADYNRKARPRLPRPAEIQALMRATFAEERRRCAETFGGPARAWPDAPY